MKHAYSFAVLTVAVVWFILFIARRDLRRQMLLMSAQAVPVAFPERLFVPAYHHPTVVFDLINKIGFSLETVVFLASFSGVTSVLYEVVHQAKEVRAVATVTGAATQYITLAGAFLIIFVSLSLTGWIKHLLSVWSGPQF